jgi:hypothetical protein
LKSVPQRLHALQHSSSTGDWAKSVCEAQALEQEAETVGLEALRRVADHLVRAAASEDAPAVIRSLSAARDVLPRIPRS